MKLNGDIGSLKLGSTDVSKAYLGSTEVYSVSSLILDTYTSSGAYSVFQLKSIATNCLRIRRSSDNTEQDIGFVDGYIDTGAITTFVGANSAYVTKWYDQVNSNDRIQATTSKQFRIVNAGTTVTENGVVSMESYSDNQSFDENYAIDRSDIYTVRTPTVAANRRLMGTQETSVNPTYNSLNYSFLANGKLDRWEGASWATVTNTGLTTGVQKLLAFQHTASTVKFFVNNVDDSTTNTSVVGVKNPSKVTIGGKFTFSTGSAGINYGGKLQECIYFGSNLDSTDRTAVSNDIISRFSL